MEDFWLYRDSDDQTICIRADIDPNSKSQLMHLIKCYKEIFSWSPTNMPRIDISVACHKLSIDLGVKLMQ